MENPIKMDDLGGKHPYFWKHPYTPTESLLWFRWYGIPLDTTGHHRVPPFGKKQSRTCSIVSCEGGYATDSWHSHGLTKNIGEIRKVHQKDTWNMKVNIKIHEKCSLKQNEINTRVDKGKLASKTKWMELIQSPSSPTDPTEHSSWAASPEPRKGSGAWVLRCWSEGHVEKTCVCFFACLNCRSHACVFVSPTCSRWTLWMKSPPKCEAPRRKCMCEAQEHSFNEHLSLK